MLKSLMKKMQIKASLPCRLLLATTMIFSMTAFLGCGDNGSEGTTSSASTTFQTSTSQPQQAGIKLDPNLKSKTGIPTADEMKSLIDLQSKVAYPVMVPTLVPEGYILQTDLIGSSAPTPPRDPVGYYNFRFSDSADDYKILNFNQSRANAKPLSAYYLTRATINGTEFLVYWHISRDYLPQGDPVEMDEVGNAEAFVVVWKGQFKDAAGQQQEVWYQMNTGSHTNITWSEVKSVLESIKPLGSVGE